MRTNCALESYNAALAQRFPKRGNFFRFVSLLANEELGKRLQMTAAVDGRAANKRNKNNLRNRDEAIEEATNLLVSDEISIDQFLERLMNEHFCQPNQLETVEESDDDGQDEIELEVDQEDSNVQSETAALEVNTCLFCFSDKPNTLFLPCRHLKSCEKCYLDFKKKTQPPHRCPMCREIIKNTIVVFN